MLAGFRNVRKVTFLFVLQYIEFRYVVVVGFFIIEMNSRRRSCQLAQDQRHISLWVAKVHESLYVLSGAYIIDNKKEERKVEE